MNFSNNESSRTQIPIAGLSNWCALRPTRSTSAPRLKHKLHTVLPLLSTQTSTSLQVVEPDFNSLRLVLQRIPRIGTVAPSPKPRLRASCGCNPPSGSETKLSEGPRLRPSESTTRSTAGRAMQVRAARTLMTGRSAATVARYVDVRALRRARR